MRPARDKPERFVMASPTYPQLDELREAAIEAGVALFVDGYWTEGRATMYELGPEVDPEFRAAVMAQIAAQQQGATTEPERVADAAAEIPFWVHDPRGLG